MTNLDKEIEITKDSIDHIRAIIIEYAEHDREAFETRTAMFRLMMDMADKLDELLQKNL